jgi:D-alanyl-D-alanine dipeptidase
MELYLNNKLFQAVFCFILLVFPFITRAQDLSELKNPTSNSRQLIVVITDDWASTKGKMIYYEREKLGYCWKSITEEISITIGKTGLAWGIGMHGSNMSDGPIKREGDGKSPAGAFILSSVYGYEEPKNVSYLKMPYIYANSNCFCIDDPISEYYNLVVDSTMISNPDWKSRERMKLSNDLYKWGIVIDHNREPRIKGSGSCIFFHITDSKDSPTAGCAVLSENLLFEMIKWLDEEKFPLLVQLPSSEYQKLKIVWKLP